MIQEGKIDPTKMLSHRVAIEELDTVYYKFDERAEADGLQKVFV